MPSNPQEPSWLDGKGGKTRIVPFSVELRKRLVRYIADAPGNRLAFATRNGTKLGRRNVLRSVKQLCRKVGFEPPARTLHAARHKLRFNPHTLHGFQGGILILRLTRKRVKSQ